MGKKFRNKKVKDMPKRKSDLYDDLNNTLKSKDDIADSTDQEIEEENDEVSLEHELLAALHEIKNLKKENRDLKICLQENIEANKDIIKTLNEAKRTIDDKLILEEELKAKLENSNDLCNKLENEVAYYKKSLDEGFLLKEQSIKDNMIISQKVEIEEHKRIIDVLRSDLEIKNDECLNIEAEVVNLRKELEAVTIQSKIAQKFDNSTNLLFEMLDRQRHSKEPTGLGYDEGQSSSCGPKQKTIFSTTDGKKFTFNRTSRKKVDLSCDNAAPKEKDVNSVYRYSSPWYNQKAKYNHSFKGYCYGCNAFGHKAATCRNRRNFFTSQRCYSCHGFGHKATSCRWFPNFVNMSMKDKNVKCYKCNQPGHIAKFCQIMLSKGNEKKGSILVWRRKCNQAEKKTSCALLAHVMPSKS